MVSAVEIANAYVALTVKAPGAKKAIEDALGAPDVRNATDNAGRSIGSRLVGAMGTVAKAGLITVGATAGAGFATALVKGFGRLNAIDTARAKLKGLGNDADTVSGVMENALNAVRGTAFGLGDAATVGAQLVAAQIPPGEKLQGVLKSVANSAAAAGTGMNDMGSIYAKVASLGKAQNDVLQQVADRGIPIYQELAKKFGVTTDEIFKMASAGKIGFDDFEQAMTSAAGTVADEMGNTVGGSWANFMASLGRIGAGLLGGVFPQIAPTIKGITSAMAPLEDIAGIVGDRVGKFLVPALQGFVGILDGTKRPAWIEDVSNGIRSMIGAFKDGEGITSGGLVGALEFVGVAAREVYGGVKAMFGAFQDGNNEITSSGTAGVMEAIGVAARDVVDSGLLTFMSPLSLMFTVLGDQLPVVYSMLTQVATALITGIGAALPSIVEMLGSFARIIAEVLPTVTPIVVGLVDVIGKGLAGALQAIGPVLGPLVITVGAGVLAFKAWGAAIMIWQGITKGAAAVQLAFNAVMNANPIMLIVTAITALVAGLVYFFTQTELGQAIWAEFTRFLGEAWANIMGFFTAAWENVIQPVFQAIGDIAVWLYETILKPVFDGIGAAVSWVAGAIGLAVDLVVNYFRFWGAMATWLWENVVQPVFKAIGDIFNWIWTNVISPVIGWIVDYVNLLGLGFRILWEQYVQPVFAAIGEVFNWIWTNIISPIVGYITASINGLGIIFGWLYENAIKPAWDGISGAISNAWNWIRDNVFAPFGVGIDAIGKAFEATAGAVAKAWEGIKQAAAAPINFVLDTIWNNGLRSFWNDLVHELKLDDMALPKAPLVKFAEGGVMPGYTPGRDVHQFWSPTAGGLALSGGEAIMRPEFTRLVGGAAGVDALNAAARAGKLPFGDGPGTFAGDVWDTITRAASMAWEFLTNPGQAIQKHVIDGIIKPMASGENIFGRTIAGLAGNTLKGLAGMFPSASSVSGGAGMGWEAMWKIVQAGVPGAVLTSAARPGAVTANGGQSYHALGRAIDLIPASMATFDAVAKLFPNASELIYSPAGKKQLLNGQPFDGWSDAVRAQHYNHVHLAMANGGVVPKLYDDGGWLPHGGIAMNLSGRPEPVFTDEQWGVMRNNGGMPRELVVVDSDGALVGRMRVEAAREVAGAARADDRAWSGGSKSP